MNKRILFVDDESAVLNGLRRSLRSQRGHWDLFFASSGQEALELARTTRLDAVVADMRMPGMSGVALLGEMARLYPWTIRMILSGQAEDNTPRKLLGSTHQYLTKPCDAQTLKDTLTRALSLRDLLQDERLQALVAGMSSLPSLPTVYQELAGRLRDEGVTAREIGETIAKDPPMTAKLLQLVNSAFFGIGRHMTNPTEAVTFLGLDTVQSLMLSAGIFCQYEARPSGPEAFSLPRLWDHSIAVGQLARSIATAEGAAKATVEDCTTAGLLHDIGKLIIAFELPDEWSRIQALVRNVESDWGEVEEEVVGTSHGALGAYLLGLWALPGSVIEAVAFHRSPLALPPHAFCPLTAVHAADSIAQADRCLDTEYLERINLADRVPAWQALRSTDNASVFP